MEELFSLVPDEATPPLPILSRTLKLKEPFMFLINGLANI